MSPFERDIAAIAAGVSLAVDGSAVVAGCPVTVAGPEGPCAGLAAALYASFYCRPAPAGAEADAAAFLEALRQANTLPPRWQAWTVAAVDGFGLLLADGAGASRRAVAAELPPSPVPPTVGQTVYLPESREVLTGPTGHYAILGRPMAGPETGRQVRFYWNLAPAGAAQFLTALGSGLERRRIPFQAKVPAHPGGYARADGGVLYLAAEDVDAACDTVAAVHRALRDRLRADAPLFTRRLGHGLAFAESPPGGESFGMHRCRLVAEALVQAGPGASVERAVEAIRTRFHGYGLDPEAPERNAATCYPYDFTLIEEAAR